MADVAILDSYNINCTDTVYIECKIAYWLWRTIPLTLLAIGVFGNILNVVVLSRRRMRRNSTTVYLLCLAGTDILFLLFGLLPDTVYAITGTRFEDYSKGFCRIRLWVLYISGAFSVWLLVLLTIERVLLTKAPVMARARLTPRISVVVSMTVLVLLVITNIHCIMGFKHHLSKEEMEKEFGKELLQVLPFPCTFATREYMTFFKGVWGLVLLIVHNILPALIIVIGNITIAVDIIMRKKRLQRVNPTNQRSSETQHRTDTFELSTTKTNIEGPRHVVSSYHGGEMSIDRQETNTMSGPTQHINADTVCRCIPRRIDQQVTSNRFNNSRPAVTTNRVKKSHSPTGMLFTLSIFFVITTFPYTFCFVLKAGLRELNERDIARWQLITVVALICGWCNYTFNFFLYFVGGTLFKQEWNRLLREIKTKFRNIFG